MTHSQSPEIEWAGMVADAMLFASARQQNLPADACGLMDDLVRRIWTLSEPRCDGEISEAQWRLFCFRAAIGTIEHAHCLAQLSPSARRQALAVAQRICDWDFASSYDTAMGFLERQTELHREIASIVKGRVTPVITPAALPRSAGHPSLAEVRSAGGKPA